MKALKSDFAKRVLANPDNANTLRWAGVKAGYGPEEGVLITLVPLNDDGSKAEPVVVNLHYVPKAK